MFTTLRLALVVILAAVISPAQTRQTFTARLAPVPIDAAMRPNVTGAGSVAANLTGTKLTLNGSFEGLRTPATVAHIHQGPVTGVRGPALLDLTVAKATSGSITGSFDLTPAQVESLQHGKLYIQIHSEKAPDGNLWGWLLAEESR